MVLVDTSVWIEVFRKPARLRLEEVSDIDEVVTALPIVQEVLQGFDDERVFSRASESMLALPIVESPLGESIFLDAARLFRSGRRAGLTIHSSIDCLLAACAIRHHLTVAHIDRDYEQLAKISVLKSRRIKLR